MKSGVFFGGGSGEVLGTEGTLLGFDFTFNVSGTSYHLH